MRWSIWKGAVLTCICLTVATAQDAQSPQGEGQMVRYRPMTDGQRLREYFKDVFSPIGFVGSAAGAGMGQWRDKPAQWGQGGKGYGLRYASAWGQHFTQASLQYGIARLLHEDDRYAHSRVRTFGPRLTHALASTFVARDIDGNDRFAAARIGAMVSAAAISRAWQPAGTDRLRSAGFSVGIGLGVTAGLNVVREFLGK